MLIFHTLNKKIKLLHILPFISYDAASVAVMQECREGCDNEVKAVGCKMEHGVCRVWLLLLTFYYNNLPILMMYPSEEHCYCVMSPTLHENLSFFKHIIPPTQKPMGIIFDLFGRLLCTVHLANCQVVSKVMMMKVIKSRFNIQFRTYIYRKS